MDSFKLNKIAGAVLGALTAILGVHVLVGEFMHEKKPEKPGMEVAVKSEGAAKPAGDAPAAAAAAGGFTAKVASADIAKGQAASKKCAACHGFEKGGPAKAGPNLYGIVGLKHAHQDGFGYSDAMRKTSDKVWDVENLGHWLENPKGYVPGTSMAFAGIKNEDERAALVAYLNSNSDSPAKLDGAAAPAAGGDKKTEAAPAPAAPAAPAEEKKAEAPAPAPAATPAAAEPIEKRLASADLARGEAFFKENCHVCHTSEKGGEAGAGPNLYGIVGLKHGHQEGFEYSDGLKAKPGNWDFVQLDAWLTDPAKYSPDNMMPYPGIEDAQERANVIAFLNKNSDNPAAIPGK